MPRPRKRVLRTFPDLDLDERGRPLPSGSSWQGMFFRADLRFLDRTGRTFFIRDSCTSDFAESLNREVRAGAATLVRRIDRETIGRILLPSGAGWILLREPDGLLEKVWRSTCQGRALLPAPRHPRMPRLALVQEQEGDPATLEWVVDAGRIADGETAIKKYEWRRRNPRAAKRRDRILSRKAV